MTILKQRREVTPREACTHADRSYVPHKQPLCPEVPPSNETARLTAVVKNHL